MSWGEIKHAVNSTLGTDEFKPLDQYIESLISIIPSDQMVYMETAFSGTALVDTVVFQKIMNYGGSLKVGGKNTAGSYATITVYVNDTLVDYFYPGGASSTAKEEFMIFSFQKGDEVKVVCTNKNSTYCDVKLYGSMTLGRMFD